VLLGGLMGLWVGCQSPPDGVQSVLTGRITLDSTVDASGDLRGFQVVVVQPRGRKIDTLAHATTDGDGHFQTTVTAPERGLYPLLVWGRDGTDRLAAANLVVAEGDSAELRATVPLRNRRVDINSPENNALAAYESAMAQHRRTLLLRVKGEAYDANATAQGIRQTSSVLWSLHETYPDTYAGELAGVEALSLLEGWNDSLVVARVRSIEPSNPRYVDAVQTGRRAAARWKGQDAARALLDSLAIRTAAAEQRAGIQMARVRSHMDSLQNEKARTAAEALQARYPNTRWAEWAERAGYEQEHLLPGTSAPPFTARTLEGDSLSLGQFQGRVVVLEFYEPGPGLYARQLPSRNTLYRALQPDSVAFVSVSVNPDTLVNRAFQMNRSMPGHQVIAPEGREDGVARAYNVVDTPIRFLIDQEGRVVGRYEGAAFLALQDDLVSLVDDSTTTAPSPMESTR
ncbi:MAG: peroxiredoxin family protein, partial [Salinivenus sp.]